MAAIGCPDPAPACPSALDRLLPAFTLGRPDDQNRLLRKLHDLVGNTSQQQTRKIGHAARPHNDEIRTLRFGSIDDMFRGTPGDSLLDLTPGGHTGVLERLDRFRHHPVAVLRCLHRVPAARFPSSCS